MTDNQEKNSNEENSKFWNKLKKSFKNAANSTKRTVNKGVLQTKIYIEFSNETTYFKILDTLDAFKQVKTISGVLDTINNCIYFKAVDDFEKDIYPGKVLLDDETNNKYEIVGIDLNNKTDYMVKIDNTYETVKCFKAIIKAI